MLHRQVSLTLGYRPGLEEDSARFVVLEVRHLSEWLLFEPRSRLDIVKSSHSNGEVCGMIDKVGSERQRLMGGKDYLFLVRAPSPGSRARRGQSSGSCQSEVLYLSDGLTADRGLP